MQVQQRDIVAGRLLVYRMPLKVEPFQFAKGGRPPAHLSLIGRVMAHRNLSDFCLGKISRLLDRERPISTECHATDSPIDFPFHDETFTARRDP
jgi:hypothetical protein